MIVSVVLELDAVAAAAQYYFRFRIGWHHCFQKVKNCQYAKQISTTHLNSLLRYNYFRFGKTNIHHVGIILPVSISTISPQSTCYTMHASACQIASKFGRRRLSNDVLSIFIARQQLTRDIDIANLSVCLSVRYVPVSDKNGLTCRHSFFLPYGSPIILVLSGLNIFTKFWRGHPL